MNEIVIALITLVGVVVTGILAIINTRISKKMGKVETLKVSNDQLALQNNIIEQLLPVFEKKDFALDRVADILEQMLRRQELNDITVKNFAFLLEKRCEAPKLLDEIRIIQNRYTNMADRKRVLDEIIAEGEEVRPATIADKQNNDT